MTASTSRTTLHLLANTPDPWLSELLLEIARDPAARIFNLNESDVDYDSVLEAIFNADTVASW